jgi:hypothetical protein
MCLRRAPEKYIAGAALDRAGLEYILVADASDMRSRLALLMAVRECVRASVRLKVRPFPSRMRTLYK